MNISGDNCSGLLVNAEPALRQQESERSSSAATQTAQEGKASSSSREREPSQTSDKVPAAREVPIPRRYHGSVRLDPTRVGRDAGRVADEVIAHLAGLVGSSVTVTLEIQADIPNGVSDNLVRTVTENSQTLKFMSYGFENE